jgi:hypothetical protein
MKAPARWLFALARRLMPPERRVWSEAMHAESAYLPDRDAARWALGCLFTATRERFLPMNTKDLRISRWVMLVEALGCFGPMTLGWYEITLGDSGLLRHTAAIVSKYYLPIPGGAYLFSMIVLGTIVGVVGPIGLYLGLRYVASGRGLGNRAFGCALIAAPLVYELGGVLGLLFGPPDFHPDPAMAVLFVLLPIAGIAHLMMLERPAPVGGGGLAAT